MRNHPQTVGTKLNWTCIVFVHLLPDMLTPPVRPNATWQMRWTFVVRNAKTAASQNIVGRQLMADPHIYTSHLASMGESSLVRESKKCILHNTDDSLGGKMKHQKTKGWTNCLHGMSKNELKLSMKKLSLKIVLTWCQKAVATVKPCVMYDGQYRLLK